MFAARALSPLTAQLSPCGSPVAEVASSVPEGPPRNDCAGWFRNPRSARGDRSAKSSRTAGLFTNKTDPNWGHDGMVRDRPICLICAIGVQKEPDLRPGNLGVVERLLPRKARGDRSAKSSRTAGLFTNKTDPNWGHDGMVRDRPICLICAICVQKERDLRSRHRLGFGVKVASSVPEGPPRNECAGWFRCPRSARGDQLQK